MPPREIVAPSVVIECPNQPSRTAVERTAIVGCLKLAAYRLAHDFRH